MRYLLIAILTILSYSAFPQFYMGGQEPSKTKWRYHNSSYGKIIYPSNLDSLARVYNNFLEEAIDIIPVTLNHVPSKFPAIIHGNSILSNGFVSWAPKRMEIVSTPSLDSDPEPWLKTLALHETRHIVQIDKLNKGYSFKFAYYLFGEQSLGLGAALIPRWFLEGDAVFVETQYSSGGRGRQASFYQYYRTHILSRGGVKYSYDKWLLGSYKDYIPNHYEYGYQLVGYTNLKYGYNIWENALTETSSRPFTLFPFYFSIKRDTGLSRKKLHQKAFSYLDSLWTNTEILPLSENVHFLLNETKEFREHKFPHLYNNTSLISLKTSLKQVPAIVRIDLNSQKEVVLHRPGFITSPISYGKNAIYWSQYSAHPRWEYQNYSEIWQYDLKKNKAERISYRTRYFNPIEIDGELVAVIENSANGDNFITVIDRLGYRIETTKVGPSLELKEICSGENDEIYARCSSVNGTVILRYKNLNSIPDTILGPTFRDISNISAWNGGLVFIMTENYKVDLFKLDLTTSNITQLTNSTFGLSNFTLSTDNKIIVSANGKYGSQPAIYISSEELHFQNISTTTNPLYNLSQLGNKIERVPKSESETEFKSHKFSHSKSLFNIHSWAPVYFNPFYISTGFVEMFPGATIISQNLTNTLVSSFGYSYNRTHGFHAHLEWLKYYPKISVGVDVGNEFRYIGGGPLATATGEDPSSPGFEASVRMRLPYKISSGYVISEANIGLRYYYVNTMLWDYRNSVYTQGTLNFEPYISFYALTRMAYRDLRPKFGAFIYAGDVSSPGQSSLRGSSFVARGGIYLPGALLNHSVSIVGQREQQNLQQYLRSPRIQFPRGFHGRYIDQATTCSIEYTFPIAYPDLPIISLIYFKRLYSNLYWDNAWTKTYVFQPTFDIQDQLLQSVGLELYADVNFFRSPYSYRLGYSAGVTLDNMGFFHSFSLGFDFSNIYGFVTNSQFLNINL
jgi:hypothetical protein